MGSKFAYRSLSRFYAFINTKMAGFIGKYFNNADHGRSVVLA